MRSYNENQQERNNRSRFAVFSNKGYDGALLRDISDSLGITKSALYKHFESKEAIWKAMIDYAKQYYSMHIGSISDIPVPSSWHEFQELSLAQINFTLHDETVKRVQKSGSRSCVLPTSIFRLWSRITATGRRKAGIKTAAHGLRNKE